MTLSVTFRVILRRSRYSHHIIRVYIAVLVVMHEAPSPQGDSHRAVARCDEEDGYRNSSSSRGWTSYYLDKLVYV